MIEKKYKPTFKEYIDKYLPYNFKRDGPSIYKWEYSKVHLKEILVEICYFDNNWDKIAVTNTAIFKAVIRPIIKDYERKYVPIFRSAVTVIYKEF